jgi:outer membrane protein
MDLQQQKDNITLNVLLAYLLVLSSRDQLNLSIEQARVDSITLVRLNEQNKEGALAPVSNLTDLQGQYAGDQIAISNAVLTLESSKVALFQLLNVPYNRDVEYQNTISATNIAEYQASSDSIFQHALQIYPSIRSAQLKVYEYQKALAVARGAYWPSLSFGAGVSTNWSNNATQSIPGGINKVDTLGLALAGANQYPVVSAPYDHGLTKNLSFNDQFKDNRTENLGISISIPILNGFQVRNSVRNAKLTLKNYQLLNTNTRYALQQNVELAFQNMIAAYKNYKFYMAQAAAYEESFRVTNIRFTQGVIASDVYILAKGHSDIAEVNLAAAKYIYIFRTKVLDYYQGKLTIE